MKEIGSNAEIRIHFIALKPLQLHKQRCSLRSEVLASFPCSTSSKKSHARTGSLLSSSAGPPLKRSYPFSIRARRWLSAGRMCSGGTPGSLPCRAARSRKPCMPTARAAL